MTEVTSRTVWFPKGSLLMLAYFIPIWAIGGLFWAFWMSLFGFGPVERVLYGGMLWAAGVWLLTAPFFIVLHRQIARSVAVADSSAVSRTLTQVMTPLRYRVEEPLSWDMEQNPSPTYLCRRAPQWWRPDLEHTHLRVWVREDRTDLVGRAILVKRVQKALVKPKKRPP